MIDRQLTGPVAQPHNIPNQRMLWFRGEHDGSKYAMYVSNESPELVLVVERGGVTVREVASVQQMFDGWAHGIINQIGPKHEPDTNQEP